MGRRRDILPAGERRGHAHGYRPAIPGLTAVLLLAAGALLWTHESAPAGPRASASITARPDTTPTTVVYGQVVEQGSGAEVGQASLLFRRIVDDSVVDQVPETTEGDGTFRLEEVPVGTYTIVTNHLGFETRHDTLEVPIGRNVRLEVPLAAEPVRMSPLRVSVRSNWLVETGFYERREKGFGKFITPAELEKRPLTSLTQALKTLPGVTMAQNCRGIFCREVVQMSLSQTRAGCDVKFYMDGQEMHGTVNPDNIGVHSLAAIEVYRGISETPGQFYGRCGSVVIWSKRSDS